jgi:hypothetical protein
MAQDRKVSKRGGLLPELGVTRGSSGAFPANISKNLGILGHDVITMTIIYNTKNVETIFIYITKTAKNANMLLVALLISLQKNNSLV